MKSLRTWPVLSCPCCCDGHVLSNKSANFAALLDPCLNTHTQGTQKKVHSLFAEWGGITRTEVPGVSKRSPDASQVSSNVVAVALYGAFEGGSAGAARSQAVVASQAARLVYGYGGRACERCSYLHSALKSALQDTSSLHIFTSSTSGLEQARCSGV
jgi:hypothetical protein